MGVTFGTKTIVPQVTTIMRFIQTSHNHTKGKKNLPCKMRNKLEWQTTWYTHKTYCVSMVQHAAEDEHLTVCFERTINVDYHSQISLSFCMANIWFAEKFFVLGFKDSYYGKKTLSGHI